MLKSVRFGFVLLDFIEIIQCEQNSSIQIYFFGVKCLVDFSRSLFVSKERKGCNVSIVLSTGSCVSGSSRLL